MGDGSFSIGPIELGVISGVVGFIFRQLMKAKDDQIASEREDKLAYREMILRNLGTTNRAVTAAEKATTTLAKEKGLDE